VHIVFLLAALNNVDVLACNVQNVYINAANKEQICFICGDEEMGTKKAK
jgi:hypothetical protein